MSEEQYRKIIIVILMTFLRMLAIFASMAAEQSHKLSMQQYKDDAWSTYLKLENKVLENL